MFNTNIWFASFSFFNSLSPCRGGPINCLQSFISRMTLYGSRQITDIALRAVYWVVGLRWLALVPGSVRS